MFCKSTTFDAITYRMLKKLGKFALLFLLVTPIALWYFLPKLAEQQINSALQRADSVHFKNLNIDFWQGDLSFEGLYIADTSGNFSPNKLKVSCKHLRLKNVNHWRYLFGKQIQLDTLIIDQCSIHFAVFDTSELKDEEQLLPKVAIRYLLMNAVKINTKLSETDSARFSTQLHAKCEGFSFNKNLSIPVNYQHFTVGLKNTLFQPENSIAYFLADSTFFSSKRHKIELYKPEMLQNLPEAAYAEYFGFDKDFVTASADSLIVAGIPENLFSLSQKIHLTSVRLFSPEAYFYRNGKLPHQLYKRRFLVERVAALPLPFSLDTLAIFNGNIDYYKSHQQQKKRAYLAINSINIEMHGLQNLENIDTNQFVTLAGDFLLYQKLPIKIDWKFDRKMQGRSFALRLDFGSAPFNILNVYTAHGFGLLFKSGTIKGGTMVAEGNDKNGVGTLNLAYNDLKISLLPKKKDEDMAGIWLKTNLANMLIKNQNTKESGFNTGYIYAVPDTNRAVFAYAVQLFFSGFKDVAIGSKNAEKVAKRPTQYIPAIKVEPKNQKIDVAKAVENAKKQLKKWRVNQGKPNK